MTISELLLPEFDAEMNKDAHNAGPGSRRQD